MPVKPMPTGKSPLYSWVSLSRVGIPIRPAMAPEISIEVTTIFFTSTPLASAAELGLADGAQVEAEAGADEREPVPDARDDGDRR